MLTNICYCKQTPVDYEIYLALSIHGWNDPLVIPGNTILRFSE